MVGRLKVLLWAVVVVASFLKVNGGPWCYDCDKAFRPGSCGEIIKCQDDEQCYASSQISATGMTQFKAGCMKKPHCNAATSPHGNTSPHKCEECCQGDHCNNQLCGGLPVPRGGPLLCMMCEAVQSLGECDRVEECGVDQYCSILRQFKFGMIFYDQGCIEKRECPEHMQGIDQMGEDGYLCCDHDLCNSDLNTIQTSPTAPQTRPVTNAVATVKPGSLTCRQCKGVQSPKHCDVNTQCGQDQMCAIETEFLFGIQTYHLDCREKSECVNHMFGAHTLSETGLLCCDQQLCNSNLKMNPGQVTPPLTTTSTSLGPVTTARLGSLTCRGCHQVQKPSECDETVECGQDQLCTIEKESQFGIEIYQLGCKEKSTCTDHMVGDHPLSESGYLCCEGYLCNSNLAMRPVVKTTTVKPSTTPSLSGPEILNNNANVTAIAGKVLVLTCDVRGNPKPDVTWNFEKVSGGRPHNMKINGSTITIGGLGSEHEGDYRCVATNKLGTKEGLIHLKVTAPLTVILKPPVLTLSPNMPVLRLKCVADGLPKPSVTWSKLGGPDLSTYHNVHLAHGELFAIGMKDINKFVGIYVCNASNGVNSTAAYQVVAGKIMQNLGNHVQFQNISTIPGKAYSMTCPPGTTIPDGSAVATEFDLDKSICTSARQVGLIDSGPGPVTWVVRPDGKAEFVNGSLPSSFGQHLKPFPTTTPSPAFLSTSSATIVSSETTSVSLGVTSTTSLSKSAAASNMLSTSIVTSTTSGESVASLSLSESTSANSALASEGPTSMPLSASMTLRIEKSALTASPMAPSASVSVLALTNTASLSTVPIVLTSGTSVVASTQTKSLAAKASVPLSASTKAVSISAVPTNIQLSASIKESQTTTASLSALSGKASMYVGLNSAFPSAGQTILPSAASVIASIATSESSPIEFAATASATESASILKNAAIMSGGLTALSASLSPSTKEASMSASLSPPTQKGLMSASLSPSTKEASMSASVSQSIEKASMSASVSPSTKEASMSASVSQSIEKASMSASVSPSTKEASMSASLSPSTIKASLSASLSPSAKEASISVSLSPSTKETSMSASLSPSTIKASLSASLSPSAREATISASLSPSTKEASISASLSPSTKETSMSASLSPSTISASMFEVPTSLSLATSGEASKKTSLTATLEVSTTLKSITSSVASTLPGTPIMPTATTGLLSDSSKVNPSAPQAALSTTIFGTVAQMKATTASASPAGGTTRVSLSTTSEINKALTSTAASVLPSSSKIQTIAANSAALTLASGMLSASSEASTSTYLASTSPRYSLTSQTTPLSSLAQHMLIEFSMLSSMPKGTSVDGKPSFAASTSALHIESSSIINHIMAPSATVLSLNSALSTRSSIVSSSKVLMNTARFSESVDLSHSLSSSQPSSVSYEASTASLTTSQSAGLLMVSSSNSARASKAGLSAAVSGVTTTSSASTTSSAAAATAVFTMSGKSMTVSATKSGGLFSNPSNSAGLSMVTAEVTSTGSSASSSTVSKTAIASSVTTSRVLSAGVLTAFVSDTAVSASLASSSSLATPLASTLSYVQKPFPYIQSGMSHFESTAGFSSSHLTMSPSLVVHGLSPDSSNLAEVESSPLIPVNTIVSTSKNIQPSKVISIQQSIVRNSESHAFSSSHHILSLSTSGTTSFTESSSTDTRSLSTVAAFTSLSVKQLNEKSSNHVQASFSSRMSQHAQKSPSISAQLVTSFHAESQMTRSSSVNIESLRLHSSILSTQTPVASKLIRNTLKSSTASISAGASSNVKSMVPYGNSANVLPSQVFSSDIDQKSTAIDLASSSGATQALSLAGSVTHGSSQSAVVLASLPLSNSELETFRSSSAKVLSFSNSMVRSSSNIIAPYAQSSVSYYGSSVVNTPKSHYSLEKSKGLYSPTLQTRITSQKMEMSESVTVLQSIQPSSSELTSYPFDSLSLLSHKPVQSPTLDMGTTSTSRVLAPYIESSKHQTQFVTESSKPGSMLVLQSSGTEISAYQTLSSSQLTISGKYSSQETHSKIESSINQPGLSTKPMQGIHSTDIASVFTTEFTSAIPPPTNVVASSSTPVFHLSPASTDVTTKRSNIQSSDALLQHSPISSLSGHSSSLIPGISLATSQLITESLAPYLQTQSPLKSSLDFLPTSSALSFIAGISQNQISSYLPSLSNEVSTNAVSRSESSEVVPYMQSIKPSKGPVLSSSFTHLPSSQTMTISDFLVSSSASRVPRPYVQSSKLTEPQSTDTLIRSSESISTVPYIQLLKSSALLSSISLLTSSTESIVPMPYAHSLKSIVRHSTESLVASSFETDFPFQSSKPAKPQSTDIMVNSSPSIVAQPYIKTTNPTKLLSTDSLVESFESSTPVPSVQSIKSTESHHLDLLVSSSTKSIIPMPYVNSMKSSEPHSTESLITSSIESSARGSYVQSTKNADPHSTENLVSSVSLVPLPYVKSSKPTEPYSTDALVTSSLESVKPMPYANSLKSTTSVKQNNQTIVNSLMLSRASESQIHSEVSVYGSNLISASPSSNSQYHFVPTESILPSPLSASETKTLNVLAQVSISLSSHIQSSSLALSFTPSSLAASSVPEHTPMTTSTTVTRTTIPSTTTIQMTTTTSTPTTTTPGEPPSVFVQHKKVSALFAGNVTLTCNITGSPNLTITWDYDKSNIFNARENGNTLEIMYVMDENNGQYICQAKNNWGVAKGAIQLTVTRPLDLHLDSPVVILDPSAGFALLRCQAGEKTNAKFTWTKYNDDHFLADPKILNTGDGEMMFTYDNTSMPKYAGVYVCHADNGISTGDIIEVAPGLIEEDLDINAQFQNISEEAGSAFKATCPSGSTTADGTYEKLTKGFDSTSLICESARKVGVLQSGSGSVVWYIRKDGKAEFVDEQKGLKTIS